MPKPWILLAKGSGFSSHALEVAKQRVRQELCPSSSANWSSWFPLKVFLGLPPAAAPPQGA
ncbi:MAG: hypothetical protein QM840_11570, partial [Verrucomicrobiota bacterium]|nr:hypothetical protein [Verrucomicrobiota bacterium]